MIDADELRLRAEWQQIPIRPPVMAELHPGGPDGDWLSISLSEPDGPRSWLHFRKVSLSYECALGDDDTTAAFLQWDIAEGVSVARRVMKEFAQNFEESMAAHSFPADE